MSSNCEFKSHRSIFFEMIFLSINMLLVPIENRENSIENMTFSFQWHIQGGSAWWIAGKLKKHKNENFSSCTFTTGFKICQYARCFDSSVCPNGTFWRYFSKLLKNNFFNEFDLTSAIKCFFKSLEELAKCHQNISCGQTDESKCLAYRHILKPVVKVL